MCAQFELEKSMFLDKLNKLALHISDFNFDQRILPHSKCPVLAKNDSKILLKNMNFSLIPYWSQEKKPKFATHNARLETIKEKPTWKHVFGKKHCLTPITSFIEPIYTGEYAGNMIKFNLKECFFVPSIYDSWTDKVTGNVIESFAIITNLPLPFVEKCGHDRSPIFIHQDLIYNWLDVDKKSDDYFYDLLNQKVTPEFVIEIDRSLKTGWEKKL